MNETRKYWIHTIGAMGTIEGINAMSNENAAEILGETADMGGSIKLILQAVIAVAHVVALISAKRKEKKKAKGE